MNLKKTPQTIYSYPKYWAHRFGIAPFLPMSRSEMDSLAWDSCDIILITGDAYVDHPSFGMAIIGRVLEAQGYRVGIIAQPDWHDLADFKALGKPNLFFGVTAGNMDSLVNHYTSDKKKRSDDAYSPGGKSGLRPDRATIVYSQLCRQAYKNTAIIIGGIEASLRRLAHYDYWSDKVRRSILIDSKADLLIYGNAERALIEVAHRIARKERNIKDIRATVWAENKANTYQYAQDNDFSIVDKTQLESEKSTANQERHLIKLPSFNSVNKNKSLYAHASRVFHHHTNPYNSKIIIQQHDDKFIWMNPPAIPLSTKEMDWIYQLNFSRLAHPKYKEQKIPAYEMIKFSINIMRGCFGGCTFCSITEHEGRIIQNRSQQSIIAEIENIQASMPDFTGVISDLGGPTANMYRLHCKEPKIEQACKLLSCIHPKICPNLITDHSHLTKLYQKARSLKGINKISIASGLRYDLAIKDKQYVKELVQHHVGGYLKIAPEHTELEVLDLMLKPSIASFNKFKLMFQQFSTQAGKQQYLIPYFIAAHPGSTKTSMVKLALWLKRNKFKLDQVQTFLPTPMALATVMYHTQINPLKRIKSNNKPLFVAKNLKQRQLQKAFIRYHDPKNASLLRTALIKMKRSDLIGMSKQHLVFPKKHSVWRRNKS